MNPRSLARALWPDRPSGIRRELLTPFLTYQIQENAYGGISSKTLAQLRTAQRDLENARKLGARSHQKPIKVGTQLLRRCGGEMRVVSATVRVNFAASYSSESGRRD
jgi:hypothetical protein